MTHQDQSIGSTAEAVAYLENELDALIALELPVTTEKGDLVRAAVALGRTLLSDKVTKVQLSAAFDRLLERIEEVDAQAHAQIVELSARLARAETTRASPPIPLNAIEAELERRTLEQEERTATQETYENERDALETELRTLRHTNGDAQAVKELEARIEAYAAAINRLLTDKAENDRDVAFMRAYQQAVKLFSAGVPANLIGRRFEPVLVHSRAK